MVGLTDNNQNFKIYGKIRQVLQTEIYKYKSDRFNGCISVLQKKISLITTGDRRVIFRYSQVD
jgi:hypothetical protein